MSAATTLVGGLPANSTVKNVYVKDVTVGQPNSGKLIRARPRMPGSFFPSRGQRRLRQPVFSPDGTRIAFSSKAKNLVPSNGDTNESGTSSSSSSAVRTPAIERVSTDKDGNQAAKITYGSCYPAWSPDSTKIAFSCSADNLLGDDKPAKDVFVKTLSGAICWRQRTSSARAG